MDFDSTLPETRPPDKHPGLDRPGQERRRYRAGGDGPRCEGNETSPHRPRYIPSTACRSSVPRNGPERCEVRFMSPLLRQALLALLLLPALFAVPARADKPAPVDVDKLN